jgi:hypothetical protein
MNILMTVFGCSNQSASCIIHYWGILSFSFFLIRVVSGGLMEIFRQFKMWTEKVEQREGNGLVKEAVHLIH